LSCPTRRSSSATRWRRLAFSAWSGATLAAVSRARVCRPADDAPPGGADALRLAAGQGPTADRAQTGLAAYARLQARRQAGGDPRWGRRELLARPRDPAGHGDRGGRRVTTVAPTVAASCNAALGQARRTVGELANRGYVVVAPAVPGVLGEPLAGGAGVLPFTAAQPWWDDCSVLSKKGAGELGKTGRARARGLHVRVR
jgi:hypothetical protein